MKGSISMEKPKKPQQDKVRTVAVLDDATLALSQNDDYVKSASSLLLESAKELMENLQKAGITPRSTYDGMPYSSKAVATVEFATTYENNQPKQLFHADNTPVYSLKVNIRSDNTDITLYAKENIESGIVFQNLTAKVWENKKPTFYRLNEIGSAPLTENAASIIAHIISNDYIHLKEQREPSVLEQFAIEANKFLAGQTDKVPSRKPDKDGNFPLVNDAYATYIMDEQYGEKIQLRNHRDNIVVELGVTQDGQDFAKVIDFTEKDADGRYPFSFVNKPEDLSAIPNEAIRIVVSSYMEFDRERTYLEEYAQKVNGYFDKYSTKVPSKKDETKTMNNDYAKYINDDYGERVRLSSQTTSISVELGKTSDGIPYARATDFSMPKADGKGYTSYFLNDMASLAALTPPVQSIVKSYMGFDKEQSKPKAAEQKSKPTGERDT